VCSSDLGLADHDDSSLSTFFETSTCFLGV
jgi:hypothetical protein